MIKINHIIVTTLILLLLILLYWYFTPQRIATELENTSVPETTEEGMVQLPNPASVHCTWTLSGSLEIVTTSSGQTGICHLPDGRRCEEWELYRTGNCVFPKEL